MAVFPLKYRDTKPTLDVFLKNPDGSAYDLTSAISINLHIKQSDGSIVSRVMAVNGSPTLGNVRYAWLASDWPAIIPSPYPPTIENPGHKMEYEVVGPSTARLTFPNDGYDLLRVTPDIGQA